MSDYGMYPNLNETGEGFPEHLRRGVEQGVGDQQAAPEDAASLTNDDPIDAEASVLFETERRKDLGFYEDV